MVSDSFNKKKEELGKTIAIIKEEITQREEEERLKAFKNMEPDDYYRWLKTRETEKEQY